MTASTIQQNLIPNEPELKDLLNLFRKDVLLGLNCHAIATIQNFDASAQTASATINYKRTYFKPDPATGVYGPTLVDYPQLIDCPVICLGGGGGALTFPITQGDECLALFNDRDLDNWYAGSSSSGVATPRLHSFSDAVLLVGLRSANTKLDDYNPDNPELRSGELVATFIKEGKLKFQNTTGELITALYNIITTATAGGFPLVVSAPDLAVLASFKDP